MPLDIAKVQDMLPQQVLEISRAIGMPATLVLVDKLGGTTWPVSKGKRQDGMQRYKRLQAVIGKDAADILAQEWGSVPLYIPRCAAALRRVRDLDINRQYVEGVRAGKSGRSLVEGLAIEYQLSDRRIWEILNQPDEPVTGDLFG